MSYNGGINSASNGAVGLEESQNQQNGNNWPFSVRYTASPYRKSKFPPQYHHNNQHHSQNQTGSSDSSSLASSSAPSTNNPSGQIRNLNHPPHLGGLRLPTPSHEEALAWNEKLSHTDGSLANVNSYLQAQKYHLLQQSNCPESHLQSLNAQLAYQNHFVALKQHHQHQQQLLQQRQRQYDHHHYGLPITALPPAVILQASAATLNKTQSVTINQHLPCTPVQINSETHTKITTNSNFHMRYSGNFGRNRVFNLNECNNIDNVDGLDEGYIEDLKQPPVHIQHVPPHNHISSAPTTQNPGEFPQQTSSQNQQHNNANSSYDPYSYVYDSQLIKEDLSVCSASVNQVFLNKPVYPLPVPYPNHQPYPSEGYHHNYYHQQHHKRQQQSAEALNTAQNSNSPHITTENEYEEIRDVQRYMNMSNFERVLEEDESQIENSVLNPKIPGNDTKENGEDQVDKKDAGPLAPKHFKSFSTSTDDILAEVVQVKQKHDRVLDQLNLEVENLLINSSADEMQFGNCCDKLQTCFCNKSFNLDDNGKPCLCDKDKVASGGQSRARGNSYSSLLAMNSANSFNQHVGGSFNNKRSSCGDTNCVSGLTLPLNSKDFSGGGTFGRRKKIDRNSIGGIAGCVRVPCKDCFEKSCENGSSTIKSFKSEQIHMLPPNGRGKFLKQSEVVDCCGSGRKDEMNGEESSKVKTNQYQKRSMSLIPKWKIRDHLMRLPFLKHYHHHQNNHQHTNNKLKKVEGGCSSGGEVGGRSIVLSHSISGEDFSTLQKLQNESKECKSVNGNNKSSTCTHHQQHHIRKHSQANMSVVTSQQQTVTTNNSPLRTRSSSMDELRSTGEEHWYSADSDTDPDSLIAIPQPPLHSPPAISNDSTGDVNTNSEKALENKLGNGNVLNGNCNPNTNSEGVKTNVVNNYCTNSVSCSNSNQISGNLYSNCGEYNGSRLDLGNGIENVPKAPKFRRTGTSGLKDKWRESWSSSSKTLLKSNSMEEDNRLLRWFSLRKNSATIESCSNNGSNRHSTLPQLTEEDLKRISFMDDEEGYWPRRTVQPPSLPPPPPDLSGEQITRRHIVAAIVHSENSYVAALQRLVNEYKKPLECSHPAILSHSKISAVFHRVPEILQCHSLFRIALAECVRKWDFEEKIGDVFVASFSKSLVLDVYSEFINNFGTAMETAKTEARRKSAFAEFLKVKQMTAHDRLSLFGLMVKPVQRFPQFILLLQDLLKHTPKDHHDRMSLQLALTQLESLAAMLNERKRESEQYQAFRETIKSIGGGKFVLLRSIVDDPNRILLRQDVVTQIEFDNNGGTVAKSKSRKLLLLNDMLICTTVTGSSSSNSASDRNSLRRQDSVDDNNSHRSGKSEKSVFKWSFPVRDVEVEDISISPTMSRFVNRSTSVVAGSKAPIAEDSASITLLEEMQSLMHDYAVLSRVLELVSTLKTSYEGLTISSVKELMLEIQHQIRCRDEQISYFDSSCLTLLLGSGNHKDKLVFQMQSPQARSAWIEELRLAQLALDPNNSPAWDIPSESPYPLHKLPLFVRALPLSKQPHLTIVKCGCFFTHTFVSQTGRSKILDYLWVSSTDGMSSHLTAFRSQQNVLKEVSSFDLVEEKVNDMLFVHGHIWVATESRKIMIYDPADTDKGHIAQHLLTDSVHKLTYYNNGIYAGLADGSVAIFSQLESPKTNLCPEIILQLGSERIAAIFGSREHVYAACGNSVITIDTKTHTIEKSVTLNHHNGPISHMTCSGVGLWITTQESETVCLYHLESFQHLQDVSIRPSVYRTVRDSFRRSKGVSVTCLTAHKGWLWIGTNLGVILTIPLPRLEGVPIISTGNANVSYHGFCGPVTFLMPLMKTPQIPALPSTKEKLPKETKTEEIKTIQESPRRNTSVVSFIETSEPILEDEDVADKSPAEIQNSTPSKPIEITQPLTVEVDGAVITENTQKETNLNVPSTLVQNQALTSDGTINIKNTRSNSSISSIENNSSPSPSTASASSNHNKTLVVLRKKSSKDNVFARNCKTLPRGGPIPSNLRFSIDSDVYGLYGNLINVRGLEEEGRFVDPLYDALRRSDPELNALDAKISTLDRRLKMRMTRPRSLDLSNWSVDSKISASSDESVGLGSMIMRNNSRGGRDSSSMTNPPSDSSPVPPQSETDNASGPASVNTNTSGTQGRNKHKAKGGKKSTNASERTVLVVVGGRGYLNMRSLAQEHYITSTDSETKSCPHLTLWQMKT